MRLISFSVSRYRSIVDARKINVSSSTVLIGKNNEGKTNILSAISTAFALLREVRDQIMGGSRRRSLASYRSGRFGGYEWNRDFPIGLQQASRGKKDTSFRIVFDLSDAEVDELSDRIGVSSLTNELAIEVQVGPSNNPTFKIVRHGPKNAKLERAAATVIDYVLKNIDIEYIPAVRTDRDALEIINRLVSTSLTALENEETYIEAIKKISELQDPILSQISKEIKETLSTFVPTVLDVSIEASSARISRAVTRNVDVIIDDGTPTLLEFKGDGIKSLVALSLTRHKKVFGEKDSVLLIEEPEAHLHPGAAHELREIIAEIAAQTQVILSTHNPVFVNRHAVKSNIIVQDGRATPAKELKDIRECLGIRVSDNLQHAELVLLVEGDSDVRIFTHILQMRSKAIASGIKSGAVAFERLGGTGNLSHRVLMLKSSVCKFYVIMDGDTAGRASIGRARDQVANEDYTLLDLPQLTESTVEDFIRPEVYQARLESAFSIKYDAAGVQSDSKWDDRFRLIGRANGKNFNANDLLRAKSIVVDAVEKSQGDPVTVIGSLLFEKIVSEIEDRLSS